MSHISTISTENLVFDLGTIKDLCKRMGWNFMENQKSYAWYGKYMGDSPIPEGMTPEDYGKCDHAISVPGANYEIGLVEDKEKGGYRVVADFWSGGGLDKILGEQGEVFAQEYNMQTDINWAESKNFSWEEVPTENRNKKLVIYQDDSPWGGSGADASW